MVILDSVDSLLEHIEEVQKDVIHLSSESLMGMSRYIEKNKLEVDEDISVALQYQDIVTQQLNATIDAIESMRKSIARFSHAFESDENLVQESMKRLQEKLNTTLAEAKEKKNRFSGKTSGNEADDEIEFF
jgi:hypothetical protein